MSAKGYLRLIRPQQWYKNLLVFLAIIFVEIPKEWPWETLPAIFRLSNYPPLIMGFLVLCAVSSSTYIINDIMDIEEDAAHPEKKNRPLPSGEVSKSTSYVLAIALLASGLVLAYYLSRMFFLCTLLYLFNSQAYNRFLSNYAVIDVAAIALGFVIRAVSGTFLIGVKFTSWLVIGVFFFALVLGFGKRKNELQLLGDDAPKHKSVFTQYTDTMLDHGISISATWVVLFYALYTYENYRSVMVTQPVMITVPVAASIILRYIYLLQIGSPVGRKPHLAIKDKGILVGAIIFGLVLLLTLFFWQPILSFFNDLFPAPPDVPDVTDIP